MVTQAFTIVSRYEFPKKGAERKGEDGEMVEDDEDEDEGWSVGHTFGPSKRAANPPKFVKPSGHYDEYGRQKEVEDDDEIQIIEHRPAKIGQWYKDLSRSNPSPPPPTAPPVFKNEESPAPAEPSKGRSAGDSSIPWFISNVVQGGPSGSSTPQSAASSMSDMLARAPPPLPGQEKFVPPVYTALGPANRGYEMLERHGWREGETLGIGASRHQTPGQSVKQEEAALEPLSPRRSPSPKGKQKQRAIDIIDLTLEDDTSSDEDLNLDNAPPPPPTLSRAQEISSHSGQALLTPLPTVLRGDKSGLGAARAVKKTIAHTAEAVRLVESMDRRRRHIERTTNPKARDVIKKMKRDQKDRDAVLKYMKAD